MSKYAIAGAIAARSKGPDVENPYTDYAARSEWQQGYDIELLQISRENRKKAYLHERQAKREAKTVEERLAAIEMALDLRGLL